MTAHELFRRLRLKTLRLRKSAMNRTTSSRSRLRILPLEDRLAPAATTFVNDNWNLITDNGTTGVVDAGDVLRNDNDTINPGAVVVTYGVDGFGTVTTGSATGTDPSFDSINDAIANTTVGGTANVLEGNYNEQVALNSSISLLGARTGVDARGRIGVESTISFAAATIITVGTGSAGATIDGFTLSGGTRGIESTSGPLNNLSLLNNRITGFTGSAVFLNDSGTDITVNQNYIDTTSKVGGGGVFHLDTDGFSGFHFTNNTITQAAGTSPGTGFFVDGNHNVGPSGTRNPLIKGNLIESQTTGMNLGSRAFGSLTVPNSGEISENTFNNNAFDGLQGGMQNVLITRNTFSNNGRSGLALTSFGNLGADRGAQNTQITENFFFGNGLTQNGEEVFFSATQAIGTIATNRVFNNSFLSVFAVTYNGTETIQTSGNWWGNATGPTVATNPGGTGQTIRGTGAANVDFSPWLDSGADQNLVVPGFQGSFSVLHVQDTSPQSALTSSTNHIQEGVDLVTVGGTVDVKDGNYALSSVVLINKQLTLIGAQAGVDARSRGAVPESVVDAAGLGGAFNISVSDVVIDGFTIQGQTGGFPGVSIWMQTGTAGTEVRNNIIQNNVVGIFVSNNSSVNQTVIERNLFQNNTNPGAASGHSIYADEFTAGVGMQNIVIDNNKFTNTAGVVNSWAVGISNTNATPFANITVSNNDISNHGRGLYFFGTDGAIVSNNTIAGTTNYAIGLFTALGADNNANVDITGNTLTANNRDVWVDGYTGTLDILNNTSSGAGLRSLQIEDSSGFAVLNLTNHTQSGKSSSSTIQNITQVNLTTNNSAQTINIDGGQFSTTTLQTATYTNVGFLDVFALDGDDTINVTPATTAQAVDIDIHGGNPVLPALPGDTLNFSTPLGQTVTVTPGVPGAGSIATTGGYIDVDFDSIETLNASGIVVINAGGADNNIIVREDAGGNIEVEIDGIVVLDTPLSSLTSLTVNGQAGDDTMTIDYSAAGGFFNLPVTFNGGTNTTGDKLVINDAPGIATTVTHTFINNNDGSVNIDGTIITYTGLEPITDNLDAVNRIFTFTGGAETVTLDASGALDNRIDSTLGESVDFVNPTTSLTVNLTNGGDTLNVQGLDAAFNANFTVDGDGGDTLNFQTTATNLGAGNLFITDIVDVNFNASVATTGAATVTATGTIADGVGAAINVAGLANLAGSSITLDNAASHNFGSLQFNSAGAVTIVETSATNLVGSNTALSLNLISAGAITDAADTDIAVTNLASFNGTSIVIGDDAADVQNFGNLTFTSTGTVNITEDSATALVGTSTGTTIVLTSAGAITDSEVDAANEIVGTDLSLIAGGGIGASAAARLHVNVTNLDLAKSGSGGIFVTDTAGGVTLTNLTGGSAIDDGSGGAAPVTAGSFVQASSPLTFAANALTNVGGGNTMTYTADDSALSGDNLTVNAGVTVHETTGALVLNVGDDLLINTTSTVRAAQALTINLDTHSPAVDAGVGSTANIFGTIQSDTTSISILGNNDDDAVVIDSNGGALGDGGTVNNVDTGVFSGFTVNLGAGADTLSMDDSGDTTGDSFTIAPATIDIGIGQNYFDNTIGLNYSNLETINIQTSSAATGDGTNGDTVTVSALNAGTTYNIDANDPTTSGPNGPGDVLILTPPGSITVYEQAGNYVFELLNGGNLNLQEFESIELTPGNGVLNIVGDEGQGTTGGGAGVDEADQVVVTGTAANEGTLRLAHGGVLIAVPASLQFFGVTDLNIDTFDLDDQVTVSPFATALQPWDIEVDVNAGAGVDRLTYNNVAGVFDNTSLVATGSGAGRIDAPGVGSATTNEVVTFTGVEDVTANANAGDDDNLTIELTAGNNTATFLFDPDAGDDDIQIAGLFDVVVDTVNYDNLTVNGNDGDDTFIIDLVGSGGAAGGTLPIALNLNGGSPNASDTLILTGNAGLPDDFTITPGANSQAGTAQIAGTDSGTTSFTGIENITLNGAGGAGIDTVTMIGTGANNVITLNGTSAASGTVRVDANPLVTFTGLGTGGSAINLNALGGSDSVVINGTAGADTVAFTPTAADAGSLTGLGASVNVTTTEQVTYVGGGGGDSLTINGTALDDLATINPTNGGSGSLASNASPAFNFTSATNVTFTGGAGGFDVLAVQGTDAADTVDIATTVIILGGTVNIGAGVDELNIRTFGGNDAVAVVGVTIPTTVDLGAGNDLARSSVGGGVRLTLQGGSGDDALFGSAGADRLEGGDGNDVMVAGGGDDFAYGGAGSDTFVWNPGDADDLFEGDEGDDTLAFAGAAGTDNYTIFGDNGRIIFNRTQGNVGINTGGVENIVANSETIAMSGRNEVPANSIANGGFANFTYNAATGTFDIRMFVTGLSSAIIDSHIHMSIPGANGPVVIPFGPGFIPVAGGFELTAVGLSTASIVPPAGFTAQQVLMEILLGRAYFNVHTVSNPGGEVRGNIIVSGPTAGSGGGDSLLVRDTTGTSLRSIVFDAGNEAEIRNGAALTDTVTVEGFTTADVITAGVPNVADNNYLVFGLPYNILVTGSDGNVVNGTLRDQLTINGNGGNDSLTALFEVDDITRVVLNGGVGDDLLSADGTLNGSDGNDKMIGGPGDNTMDGGAGDDSFVGNGGTDNIGGGAGSSVGDSILVDGTNGADVISLSLSATGQLLATVNGSTTTYANFLGGPIATSGVEQILVQGLGGADSLTIDSTNGAIPVAITFDGGVNNDSLTFTGGTATSDTYTPGPNPGQGTSAIVIGGVTQTVQFTNLEPVIDLVAGPLAVNANNADNAINYGPGAVAGNGLVSIDINETIEFSNKTTLTINALAGNDTVNLNNANTPTGLTAINVNGGDPTGSDTIVVNGTTGSNAVLFDILGEDSATVIGLGPVVNVASTEHLVYNGRSGATGDDAITYQTPTTNDGVTLTPGVAPDQASISARQELAAGDGPLLGLDYSNLGAAGSLTIANSGGGQNDLLELNGTANDDVFNLTATSVQILNASSSARRTVVINLPNMASVELRGLDGNDVFNVPGVHPYFANVLIEGGNSSTSDKLNFTGSGADDVTVDLEASTIVEAGSNIVAYSGIEILNANAAGQNVSINATIGDDVLTATPTGADAVTAVLNSSDPAVGSTPIVNASGIGSLNIDLVGGVDQLVVNGTNAGEAITVTGALVTIGTLETVNFAGAEDLRVNGRSGNDTFLVSASPTTTITIDGGDSIGALPGDRLNLNVTLADTVTFSAGPTNDSGGFLINANLPISFIHIDTMSYVTPSAMLVPDAQLVGKLKLVLVGSDSADIITVRPVSKDPLSLLNKTFLVNINGGPSLMFDFVTGHIQINGNNGDDFIYLDPSIRNPAIIDGGAGNDSIASGAGNDLITGGLGNDTMDGGRGLDRLVEAGDVDMTLVRGTTLVNGSLTGGLGTDVLLRNRIESAHLTGGAGANTLDASAFTGQVFLFGLGGDDILRGGTKNDILVGGNNNDQLFGGNGLDLLIGGLGMDTIDGGRGNDIVIGGNTAYDANLAALESVMKEWSRTSVAYKARVNRILGTLTNGKNAPIFLSVTPPGQTVFDDLAVDSLTGGISIDWFMRSTGDNVTDPVPLEIQTVVP